MEEETAAQKAIRVADIIEAVVENEGCNVSVEREGVFLVANVDGNRHSAPLFYEPF